ncbi:MAG: YigZ family protein [Calditrichaeota bacterium]|nr:MAG: YigZ family protein [Calditrichota bacterium]MBL1205276.1 YigZ family protein [Calditrichota bacterium]NOG45105.1 YigZ family protein [Calditrichota bacterium]
MNKSTTLKPDDYLVPKSKHQHEIKVKGSRFLCTVIPCASKKEAEEEYAAIKKKYYDATHNCFAWRINQEEFRYSDDGEPSGTAGKPILQAIDGKELKEVLCIVTRYYGGTKLGTGGLIRAYGDSTVQALTNTPIKIKTHWAEVNIEFDYTFENLIRRTLAEFNGKIEDSDYSEIVKMRLALPQSVCDSFKSKILETTNSQINIS